MASYANCFVSKATGLLNDLIGLFPQDEDLRIYKSALLVTATGDEFAPVTAFKEHVTDKFENYIKNRDENFFLGDDFETTLGQEADSDTFKPILNKVRGYWNELEADDRDAIWSVLHLMCALSKKALP